MPRKTHFQKSTDINNDSKDIIEPNLNDLTPRMKNPVQLLRRKRSLNHSDSIPSEREGPAQIPLLNPHVTSKPKINQNKLLLTVHNKSTYALITRSVSSHE